MKIVKIIFHQMLLVCFLMTVVLAIGETINFILTKETFYLQGSIPATFIVVSFLTSLPTALYHIGGELSKTMVVVRNIVHFILVYAIVVVSGYVFGWYSSFNGFISITCSIIIIYALVWVFTALMSKHDERLINETLANIRDDE